MIDAINDTDIIPAHVALDEPHRIVPCWACRREHTVRLSDVAFNITCECGRFIHVSPPAPCGGLSLPRQGRRDGKGEGSPAAEPPATPSPGYDFEIDIVRDLEFFRERLAAACRSIGTAGFPQQPSQIQALAIEIRELIDRLVRLNLKRTELPLIHQGNIGTILQEAQT